MASTDPEINDGFSLPVWMKTRPTKDFEPFAASPPAPEDSFFCIKYPKSDLLFGKQKIEQDLKAVLQDQPKVFSAANYKGKEQDWSKHTKPCQDVLHGIAAANPNATSTSSKVLPLEDEFKGEGAACGTSVLKVANKMISSRPSMRGFTVASPADDETVEQAGEHYARHRRGSKSLPASPAHSPPSSPNSRRKNGHRYFTSPFEPAAAGDGSGRSWLTAALLGFKKELTTSSSTLAEEDALEARLQGATLAESVENLGPAPKGKDTNMLQSEAPSSRASQPPQPRKPAAFRPKPSELREMNFWSPTSM